MKLTIASCFFRGFCMFSAESHCFYLKKKKKEKKKNDENAPNEWICMKNRTLSSISFLGLVVMV